VGVGEGVGGRTAGGSGSGGAGAGLVATADPAKLRTLKDKTELRKQAGKLRQLQQLLEDKKLLAEGKQDTTKKIRAKLQTVLDTLMTEQRKIEEREGGGDDLEMNVGIY
jgi:hypothetical protein